MLLSLPRRSVFLATKLPVPLGLYLYLSLYNATAFVCTPFDNNLPAFGTDYLDMLMLREGIDCTAVQDIWVEMERTGADRWVHSPGVVNYRKEALRCLLSSARLPVSVNYFQI